MAGGVGGAGLEGVGALAAKVGRIEGRTPGGIGAVLASRGADPGEAALAVFLDAQLGQLDAGGGVADLDAEDHVLVGTIVVATLQVGAQHGGGIVRINRNLVALALLDPAPLVEEDVTDILVAEGTMING